MSLGGLERVEDHAYHRRAAAGLSCRAAQRHLRHGHNPRRASDRANATTPWPPCADDSGARDRRFVQNVRTNYAMETRGECQSVMLTACDFVADISRQRVSAMGLASNTFTVIAGSRQPPLLVRVPPSALNSTGRWRHPAWPARFDTRARLRTGAHGSLQELT